MIVEIDLAAATPRRCFLKKILTLATGAIAGLVPAIAGMTVFLDPVHRRSTDTDKLIKIATLDALPEDGKPRKFAVIANHTDAWNKYPQVPIGAVYVRRSGPATLQAFNVVCPHAGCFVDYVPELQHFRCPCHGSTFTADGRILDPRSPSPRGLDALEVEIRNGTEIWIRFQNYLAGQKARIPLA